MQPKIPDLLALYNIVPATYTPNHDEYCVCERLDV